MPQGAQPDPRGAGGAGKVCNTHSNDNRREIGALII